MSPSPGCFQRGSGAAGAAAQDEEVVVEDARRDAQLVVHDARLVVSAAQWIYGPIFGFDLRICWKNLLDFLLGFFMALRRFKKRLEEPLVFFFARTCSLQQQHRVFSLSWGDLNILELAYLRSNPDLKHTNESFIIKSDSVSIRLGFIIPLVNQSRSAWI